MLTSQRQIRLLGLRYGVVFAGLGLATAVLIILLFFSIPPGQDHAAIANAARQVQSGWIRLVVLFSLLGVIATAAAVTVYSYLGTKAKLSRMQTTAKAILESMVGGVLTFDTKGNITIINRAASQILEVSSELPYADLEELSQKHGALAALIRSALATGQYVQDQDSTFLNSRNEHVVLRTSISEQIDEAGRRVGIVVLVKDVSKLVALENELRKRDRLATAGTLAAGVAHEIRNPLSALELNLRLLRDEVASLQPTSPDIEGYFEILSAETRRLNRITSNFLELSRPQPILKAELPLHQPITQVVRLLEREAEEKKISIVLNLSAGDPIVLGNATKLEQLCLNILINAMQAMPGGGTIRVSSALGSSEDRNLVTLAFADQGVGVAPENVPRMFDPYFTTRADGTGLGLAIADRIVTDHGGKIFVESVPGFGTTMTISLPLADRSDARTELEMSA